MKPFNRTWPCLFALGIGSAAFAVPPSYTVTYLGDNFSPASINHLGDVAGRVVPASGATIAHVSIAGQPPVALPLPPGYASSAAYDINELREIVGVVSTMTFPSLGSTIPAVWRPTSGGYSVEVLSPLPGDFVAYATAINNVGDIVGGSGGIFGNSFGVLWTPTGLQKLGDFVTAISDVNDERIAADGLVLIDLDTMTSQVIDPPLNKMASVVRLNEFSDFCSTIVGFGSSCANLPGRYIQGIGWEILGGCSNFVGAYSINDLRDVTIYYSLTQAASVHIEGEGVFPTGSLIAPGQGAWFIKGSGFINNKRQIAVTALNMQTNKTGAILMTPMATACAPDCDASGTLTIDDFICFQTLFAIGDPSADCDASGTLSIDDFICFQTLFALGC